MLGKLRMTNLNWCARALHALKNASRIRAREAEPWTRMGELQHRMGSDSQAGACFRKALELDPSAKLPPGIQLK
jgi:Flp pilus assembly protein TadD